jgi:hypothetical protein
MPRSRHLPGLPTLGTRSVLACDMRITKLKDRLMTLGANFQRDDVKVEGPPGTPAPWYKVRTTSLLYDHDLLHKGRA